jgi:hypothetical protein
MALSRMLASHRGGPGPIPGRNILFSGCSSLGWSSLFTSLYFYEKLQKITKKYFSHVTRPVCGGDMLANAVHPDLGPRHHVPILVSDQASQHTPAQDQNRVSPFTAKKIRENPNAYSLPAVGGLVGQESNARSKESGQKKRNSKSVRKSRKFSEKKCGAKKKCQEEPGRLRGYARKTLM